MAFQVNDNHPDVGSAASGVDLRPSIDQGVEENNDESDSSSDDLSVREKKEKSRRPPDNAFSQQRLRSFNPVFTAKTVISFLMLIAILFVPLGGGMWYAAHSVEDFVIEYTECQNEAERDYWTAIPSEYITNNIRSTSGEETMNAHWRLFTDSNEEYTGETDVCRIQFVTPKDLSAPIYLFYRLKNFYANHRRYVKSFSEEQLEGHAASEEIIKHTTGQNCEPLSTDDEGRRYYPCGLIANSMFNDTFATTLRAVNGTSEDYEMTDRGIAWATDKDRFKKTEYDPSEVVPPPNWRKRFPDGYNESNLPDISTWYQFQNWMHPSALSPFNKLALRNDNDVLRAGTYEVSIGLHFPTEGYNGKKYIYITQRSVLGGKNFFLGYSWMIGGGVCLLLALTLVIINTIKPRKTGDVNLLSWNKEQFIRDEADESHPSPLKPEKDSD